MNLSIVAVIHDSPKYDVSRRICQTCHNLIKVILHMQTLVCCMWKTKKQKISALLQIITIPNPFSKKLLPDPNTFKIIINKHHCKLKDYLEHMKSWEKLKLHPFYVFQTFKLCKVYQLPDSWSSLNWLKREQQEDDPGFVIIIFFGNTKQHKNELTYEFLSRGIKEHFFSNSQRKEKKKGNCKINQLFFCFVGGGGVVSDKVPYEKIHLQ